MFVTGRGQRLTAKRLALVLGACAVACAAVAVIGPLLGVVMTRDGRAIELLGLDAFDAGSPDHKVLMVRLPRVLGSMLIGAALAGAGCVLQALFRNPLAEPFTLGISSGASFAAVLAIRLGVEDAFGGAGVSIAALAGAIGALVFVERLGRIGKHLPPATLVLAGVTISMFCSSASVLVQYTSDFADVSHMLAWMIGALDSVRMVDVQYASAPIGIGLVLLFWYARELNALWASRSHVRRSSRSPSPRCWSVPRSRSRDRSGLSGLSSRTRCARSSVPITACSCRHRCSAAPCSSSCAIRWRAR
jgi:iron complex transport system permease protein